MSREELLQEIIEISRGIRQQEIDLGRQMEQERIIELLEEHSGDNHDAEECDHCWKFYGMGAALALIKGEKK